MARHSDAATHAAHCRCGAVEVVARGEPIAVNACYCNDCQAAGRSLAACAQPAALTGADGGTEFLLFRRDRIACTRGAERLQPMRLTEGSKTRRMIASCCGMPMYMAFDDQRPWVSAFRATFGGDAPAVQRHICTRFRVSEDPLPDDLPSHRRYPLAMILRILAVWPLVQLSKPAGALP